ncbi:MAG: Unknown protein [uncultured Sulfurovum sp.]|uniref:Uncharacterized protein n=1 Tax=uncultured Sulfurovum sp. TaxID=269237 RepID=A0A6S6TY37_9BACT|nr:MAG: Unknown protein [uncultured Sulfurovum sp.]
MNKTLLFLAAVTLVATTGCSKTWSGVKQDSSSLWKDTKEVVHDATAPQVVPQVQAQQTQVANIESTELPASRKFEDKPEVNVVAPAEVVVVPSR